jgi:seryl-tRNA synthetase
MKLECTLTLSKEAIKAKGSIAKFVEEANKTILLRGAPKGLEGEAARIVDWKLDGRVLELKIDSGTYVRAPAAALRIKKSLGAFLGKNYGIGVRDLKARDITITIPVKTELDEEVIGRIRALPVVKAAAVLDRKLNVTLNEMNEKELRRNIPDKALRLMEETIEKILKPSAAVAALPIVKQSEQKPIKFNGDPMKTGIELGWIKEFPARGQWIYTTPYAQLFEIIKQTLIEEVAHKQGFQPFMLPKLIPLEVMKKMPGYLDDIPEGMYYVCPPPRDPEAFKTFKEKLKITGEIPKDELMKVLKEPEYVLAPAQCEPFWQFYYRETLNADEFPYKFYDCSGWTYRWEGGGAEGIVRLQEFQRIELSYLGTPEQIVEIRDKIVDECVRVADKILDMEWRITAATPFWAREGKISVDIHDSKNISAYDVEIYMPYKGPRDKAEWLEVAGCFVHQTKFIDGFKIKELKGRRMWTGCSGLGLSRWVAAFLATHGFNPDDWPKALTKSFNKNYKLPSML